MISGQKPEVKYARMKGFMSCQLKNFTKDITEVKTHKRNLYRKRYDLLDTLILSIKNNLTNFLK